MALSAWPTEITRARASAVRLIAKADRPTEIARAEAEAVKAA